MKDVILAALTGGIAVEIIRSIVSALAWKRNRKAEKEDKAEEKKDIVVELQEDFNRLKEEDAEKMDRVDETLSSIQAQNEVFREALKLMMLDRIIHLGQSYIDKGSVTFEERKRLRDMHNCYHNGLEGNGDANLIMEAVDELPLK